MTVEAFAKVNLSLEVYGRRADGYHALRSLVRPVSLADTLEVVLTRDGRVVSDSGFADDLCVAAARALVPRPSCRIRVTKRIPVGGGLGGGSADAAATLRALNELMGLGRSPEELASVGAAVGSDVPALVLAQHYRRGVLMEGRGERVSLLPPEPSRRLVLANPGVKVSTAEIYGLCKPRTTGLSDGSVNDLQAPAVARHPEIGRTLMRLRQAGATGVRMSGSGATCFGFVADADAAARVADDLRRLGETCWLAETL